VWCEWCHGVPPYHKRACIAVRTHATAKAQWQDGFAIGRKGWWPESKKPCYMLGWVKGRIAWAWSGDPVSSS